MRLQQTRRIFESYRNNPGRQAGAIISILIILIAFSGCSHPSPSGLPTTAMMIGSKNYQLEIAATDASREHGLMDRDTLDSNHGMIFLFAKPEVQDFWMKHTHFPLDIIFADGNAKVVWVDTMRAYTLDNTSSHVPAKYAIELSAGQAAANGVKIGDKLQLPKEVLTSAIE